MLGLKNKAQVSLGGNGASLALAQPAPRADVEPWGASVEPATPRQSVHHESIPVADLLVKPSRTLAVPLPFEELGVRQVVRATGQLSTVLATAVAAAAVNVAAFGGILEFGRIQGLGMAVAVPMVTVVGGLLVGGAIATYKRLKGAESYLLAADAEDARKTGARATYRDGLRGLVEATDSTKHWGDFVEVHTMLLDHLRHDMGVAKPALSPKGKDVYDEFMAVVALCKRPLPRSLDAGVKGRLAEGVRAYREDQKVFLITDPAEQGEFFLNLRGLSRGDAKAADYFAADYGRHQLALAILENHFG